MRLRLREIRVRKPTWGIRRVRAWVRKSLGIAVGRKRTARLLREERLLCPRINKRQYRRLQPRSPAGEPNQV